MSVDQGQTTRVVERYLLDLADVADGDSVAEPIVRTLLATSANRLHLLCSTMLFRSYPRLTRPPLNLRSEELLSSVIERLLKALRAARPQSVRQFFALANQHMRWELNDLARRLDDQDRAVELHESAVAAPVPSVEQPPTANASRILSAIEALPQEQREVFDLVRIQGMTQPEAAALLGVSIKTVQRRLNRGLALLSEELKDLVSPATPGRAE